jgi:peptidoglycan/xylan/chitin deacetylase (PgdA/CDA1 family)
MAILQRVLQILEKHRLRAMFFITGSVAKELKRFPTVVELLGKHEIGYHSSTHSVKPRIFEYTDIEDYNRAVEISKERETSTIDVETGDITGEGGINLLRRVFPRANVTSFRAPFLCWSPPHLEALRELGFKYDFSVDFCRSPIFHKGITFYPYPIAIDNFRNRFFYTEMKSDQKRTAIGHALRTKPLDLEMLREKIAVLLLHPASLGFEPTVPSYRYYEKYPLKTGVFKPKDPIQSGVGFFLLESLLTELNLMKAMDMIDVTPSLAQAQTHLNPEDIDTNKVYRFNSQRIARLFGYNPKFLLSHLKTFLNCSD